MTKKFRSFLFYSVATILVIATCVTLAEAGFTKAAADTYTDDTDSYSAYEHFDDNDETAYGDEHDVVFSYMDIFREYYTEATRIAPNLSKKYPFEKFISGYYENSYSIDEYTALVVEDFIVPYSSSSSSNDQSGGGSTGDDAYYILKESCDPDKSATPASDFARKPIYDSIFDYSILHEGDIVYETTTSYFNIGHDALIYDMSKNSEYGSYIQTIEAVGGGVQFGYLDDSRMVDFGVKILRVKDATDSVVENVKYFFLKQLGKPYTYNFWSVNTSIDTEKWYCSELVYASYMYAGICIWDSGIICRPSEIYSNENTYQIVEASFLDLAVVGKDGSYWHIAITNPTDSEKTVYYNEKMCFKGDAANWTDLSHVTSVEIGAYESVTVDIKTNVTATSITACYIWDDYRVITYANHLDKSGTLDIYYSFVKV